MNAYEFIVKMKDIASSQLKNIARSVGVAKNELYSFNTGMNTTEKTASRLGSQMGKLKGQTNTNTTAYDDYLAKNKRLY